MAEDEKSKPLPLQIQGEDGKPIIVEIIDGKLTVKSPIDYGAQKVASVGVVNLCEIESFALSKAKDKTTIFATFKDGGSFDLSYLGKGNNISVKTFSCLSVARMTDDGISFMLEQKDKLKSGS